MSEAFKNSPTFQLFKHEPSAVSGMATLLDLGSTLNRYVTSKTENDADRKALKSDWQAVGNDMKSSIDSYGEHTKQA